MWESALGTVDTFEGCSTSDVLLPVVSGRGMPAHLFLLTYQHPYSTVSVEQMIVSIRILPCGCMIYGLSWGEGGRGGVGEEGGGVR